MFRASVHHRPMPYVMVDISDLMRLIKIFKNYPNTSRRKSPQRELLKDKVGCVLYSYAPETNSGPILFFLSRVVVVVRHEFTIPKCAAYPGYMHARYAVNKKRGAKNKFKIQNFEFGFLQRGAFTHHHSFWITGGSIFTRSSESVSS